MASSTSVYRQLRKFRPGIEGMISSSSASSDSPAAPGTAPSPSPATSAPRSSRRTFLLLARHLMI
jgi:hypothetical protein